jgi:hypothetical protein
VVRNHGSACGVSIRGSLREQLPFETASFLGLLKASLDHRDGWAAGRRRCNTEYSDRGERYR